MDFVDWILLVVRVGLVFVVLLVVVMLVVWAERKIVADMQVRLGPKRAGPFGILITLADGIKLFFKEGIVPAQAERSVFTLAPIASLIPAILAFAVVPFGTGVELFGREIPFQIADLNVGVLFFLAMGSLAIYGIVLGGWASGSAYPLLGAIRSSAQMISYEIGMGLGVAAVLMYAGTMQMSGLVDSQAGALEIAGVPVFPRWNILPQFPAFLIFAYAALAESNRPPFDLPESETELVAGYHTEYSGIRFAMFFLAEYLHLVTISAVAVTLFLGGWRGPIFDFLPWLWPLVWFTLKVSVLLFVFFWVRATIPRIRYDRLMNFGWKVIIPWGFVWILATGAIVVLPDEIGRDTLFRAVAIGAGVTLFASVAGPVLFRRKPASQQEVGR